MQRPCGDCGQKHEAGDVTKPYRVDNGTVTEARLIHDIGVVRLDWRATALAV